MKLSIVIPTRDRRAQLLATLAALDRQVLPDGVSAELLICDNGSSDGTAEALDAWRGSLALRALHEPREGASHARNRCLAEASGDVALLLGDDMVPASDDLFAGHATAHAARGADDYAVLGRIAWAPDVEDDFLRWTERAGLQFSYDGMAAGPVDITKYLYSSHASLKVGLLRAEEGFDERFPYLGEDTELGIRLRRRGVVLDYRPELLVHHHHAQTLGSFTARMAVNGEVARRLHEVHGEEAPAELTRPNWKWPLYRPAAVAGRALLRARARGALREKAWTAIVMDAYVRGYGGP